MTYSYWKNNMTIYIFQQSTLKGNFAIDGWYVSPTIVFSCCHEQSSVSALKMSRKVIGNYSFLISRIVATYAVKLHLSLQENIVHHYNTHACTCMCTKFDNHWQKASRKVRWFQFLPHRSAICAYFQYCQTTKCT